MNIPDESLLIDLYYVNLIYIYIYIYIYINLNLRFLVTKFLP